MAKITRIGYGQVEPNHLSAQRTSQIYAQLPANKDIATTKVNTRPSKKLFLIFVFIFFLLFLFSSLFN